MASESGGIYGAMSQILSESGSAGFSDAIKDIGSTDQLRRLVQEFRQHRDDDNYACMMDNLQFLYEVSNEIKTTRQLAINGVAQTILRGCEPERELPGDPWDADSVIENIEEWKAEAQAADFEQRQEVSSALASVIGGFKEMVARVIAERKSGEPSELEAVVKELQAMFDIQPRDPAEILLEIQPEKLDSSQIQALSDGINTFIGSELERKARDLADTSPEVKKTLESLDFLRESITKWEAFLASDASSDASTGTEVDFLDSSLEGTEAAGLDFSGSDDGSTGTEVG